VSYPIVLLCGKSGSGKDTAAGMLRDEFGSVSIAMADPIKRFCALVLGFDNQALWGESSLRNALDTRFATNPDGLFSAALSRTWSPEAQDWIGSLEISSRGNKRHWVERRIREKWIPMLQQFVAENGGLTARYALQTLGTEIARQAVGPDVWVNKAIKTAEPILLGRQYHATQGVLVQEDAPVPFVVITDGRFPNEILRVKRAGGYAILIESPDKDTGTHASENSLKDVPQSWFDSVIWNDKLDLGSLRRAMGRTAVGLGLV